ncbi:helix-turn-helix domain-containing protein [Alicyclobacillus sp. SO9]|uniref:helix-turn-helix domain-containing protein n=1 Tax=Alicyclobacillus sp. SO9 TaxID=2665646 RepID=UPI0018E76B6C|nr:AraC family transcriptional regulator [Alicyclobacillus sp. SO9]QQE79130.1 helix-turn-helix transcriptional regulator [Alicyclobacillus sp. SO9]
MNKITSLRASTREELYRRVSIANEVILDHFRDPVSLEQLSKAAMLSVNHLIRNYKLVYGVTPHQHMIFLRLLEAERLLQKSALPVSEICSRIGFESLGSFITIFHRVKGVSPQQFRKQSK